jgi:hypothetical protein
MPKLYELAGFADKAGEHLAATDPTIPGPNECLAWFPAFPTFMGCVTEPATNDVFAPMLWCQGGDRAPLEVRPILPEDLVYRQPHNDAIGPTWHAHHAEFGDFVARNARGKSIYEVGAAHGRLSLEVARQRPMHWTMHDLSPQPIPEYEGDIVSGAFSASTARLREGCETVVHSHTLEHVHNPSKFLSHISDVLPDGGRTIFSWPNMDAMLRRCDLNFLNFEHTAFLPEAYVQLILQASGFQVEELHFFGDHSIFISAIKAGVSPPPHRPSTLLLPTEIQLFHDYFDALFARVKRMNDKLASHHSGPRFVFGGHVFTQMLLAAGLDERLLDGCLDNSPLKWEKRLYGTNLHVSSPEVALKAPPTSDGSRYRPLVLLAAGAYQEEIQRQLEELTRGTVLVVT